MVTFREFFSNFLIEQLRHGPELECQNAHERLVDALHGDALLVDGVDQARICAGEIRRHECDVASRPDGGNGDISRRAKLE